VGYLGDADGAANFLIVLGLTYGSVSAAKSRKKNLKIN
jgi:hypothetical protein